MTNSGRCVSLRDHHLPGIEPANPPASGRRAWSEPTHNGGNVARTTNLMLERPVTHPIDLMQGEAP
jgi:hypothetical protein